MQRIVFYSWQSDLPSAGNRNLIQESLERAIRAIGRDHDAGIQAVLDRDTANLAGSPDIANSILAKIAVSDVFVADVSIVNASAARPSPNPNVLVELGYAIAELGWENTILVQNGVYGGPELLPFDLRGRRTVVYHKAGTDQPAEPRALLQGRLETALRSALTTDEVGNLPSGANAPVWWGRWTSRWNEMAGGNLFIREVGPRGFLFDLAVFNGAHHGRITSYARLLSHDLAFAKVPNGPGEPAGELVFRRKHSEAGRAIEINEAARCRYWGGMRAHFSGNYIHESEPWFESGLMNELELARLYQLVGEYMSSMRTCTSDIGLGECADGEGITVVWGGVAGLYTQMESIVMFDQLGQMWAAYIDSEEDCVRYFTNVPDARGTLPATIEKWRENFADKTVRYCDPARVVPVSSM
ncbi:hypothetical protein [Paracidovorax wautersii]|uniref:Uncharacterized protein n=1 Tax=Paracidovorax wautersii TaxID=1177982 RepID=A0A1I2GWT7_9BURK|nr:hypothetical protein [Paracidovorax wautersii]SFF22185.1 hypothetical protein SAMN04489711_11788 [Paracidovorax wautersii]